MRVGIGNLPLAKDPVDLTDAFEELQAEHRKRMKTLVETSNSALARKAQPPSLFTALGVFLLCVFVCCCVLCLTWWLFFVVCLRVLFILRWLQQRKCAVSPAKQWMFILFEENLIGDG